MLLPLFAIKRRRDNVKKKIENVNEDTIGNEIVTSDQPVNAMQAHFYSGLLLSACSLASDNTFTS